MSDDDVFRSLLPFALARTGLQYALGAVFDRGPGTTSLLDTTPLQRTAREVLSTEQLATNVADGLLASVGVATTRMPTDSDDETVGAASGRSVLFLDETAPGDYAGDPGRALDVVRGPITAEQVLASSAIPVAFPPIRIPAPEQATGWYVDGGVRLNAPLQPAVGLGATRILLISATSTTYSPPPPPTPTGRTQDIADAAAQVLHAVLADRMVEDLATLRRMNRLLAQAESAGRPGPAAHPQRCPVPAHPGDRRQPTTRGDGHPRRAGVRPAHRPAGLAHRERQLAPRTPHPRRR